MSKNYKHDCNQCTFLGEYEPGDGKTYDLYSCHTSLIARFSDHPPDYYSCPRSLVERLPKDALLREVSRRDKNSKLYSDDT